MMTGRFWRSTIWRIRWRSREDRTYVITPAYYLDSEDKYEYRKQIPYALKSDDANKLTLFVGDRFDEPEKSPSPDYIGLRLGLRNANPTMSAEIALNGVVLHRGSLDSVFTPTPASNAGGGANGDPATSCVQLLIKDPSIVHAGKNTISIRTAEKGVIVSECLIAVRYHHKLFSW